MSFIEKWNNVLNKAKNMKESEIKGWKNFLFFMVIVDIFGIWWFLELKRLAMAFLFVILAFLGFILYLERGLPPLPPKTKPIKPKEDKKMEQIFDNEEPEGKETQEQEPQEQDSGLDLGFDTGLPSSEEYNKRMENAMGRI